MARLAGISANVNAFLDLIAWSEGTSSIPDSDDGYKVIVGSTLEKPILMAAYALHPRRKVWMDKARVWSTAAGRYQIIARTWDRCLKILHLPDFGPESQDRAAILLIQGRKAYDDVEAGRVQDAARRCAGEWASFPGNTYGQHEDSMQALLDQFVKLGGDVH